MNRCVNIDWLEVFCAEEIDVPRDALFFRARGFDVKQRQYGTPQYQEMFTLYKDGFPYIEIRRNPYSLKSQGGIFAPNDCHVRLSNRSCYLASPVNELRGFLLSFGYEFKSLSRIDICLDFNVFDMGDVPENVVVSFMKGKISKINQCRVAAHGKDNWDGRVWNSLKWGSPSSMVTTKLYNKSLELKEVHDKFYIRDAWQAAGLNLDRNIWRVEFSVKSDLKNLVRLDTGEFLKNDLNIYDTREKLLSRFHIFASHYFHFKYFELTRDGKPQRKDRCRDKVLFKISPEDSVYRPMRLTLDHEPSRTDKLIIKRLLINFYDVLKPFDVRHECYNIALCIARDKRLIPYMERLKTELYISS